MGFIYYMFLALNYINKKDIIRILEKNEITCIFYSVIENSFFSNHIFKIADINCEKEFCIEPYGEYRNKLKENSNSFYISKFKRPYPNSNITSDMTFDLAREYEIFSYYIRNDSLIEKEIIDNLGNFISFHYYCYGYYSDDDSPLYKYFLLFYIKEKENNCVAIDYDNDIALIYYKEEKECFLNIKNPLEVFKSKREFKTKYFGMCVLKGLWKKNISHN